MRLTNVFLSVFAMIVLAACQCQEYVYRVDVKIVDNQTITDVVPLTDTLVEPIIYQRIVIDQQASPEERKAQFISQVLPAILITKYYLDRRVEKVENLISQLEVHDSLSQHDQAFLDSLLIRYNATDYHNLILCLKPHPASLVLAQAALESGWGKSRFVEEGNNLFGIKTFENDSNAIKARFSGNRSPIYIRRYNTLAESVEHYFLILGRHTAYKSFRKTRSDDVTVYQLIDKLNRYSELGTEYGRLLKQIIRANGLEQYDKYRIRETAVKNCWYIRLKNKILRN